MRNKTDYVIIHCAATRPSMDIGFREIDKWHRAKSWLSCGYHFIIRRNGTIETGRKLMDPGAHAKGYNHRSIGICMVGGVTEDDISIPENNFTDVQWTSLETLYNQLNLMPEIDGASWIGHNEVSPKDCPSFNVQEWVQSIEREKWA